MSSPKNPSLIPSGLVLYSFYAFLYLDYRENTPTGIAIESYEWNMVGIVWNCPVVTVYKNGEAAFNFDIQDPCGQSSLLVMSANSGTCTSQLLLTLSLPITT